MWSFKQLVRKQAQRNTEAVQAVAHFKLYFHNERLIVDLLPNRHMQRQVLHSGASL